MIAIISIFQALLYKRADHSDSFILHPTDYSDYWQLGGYFGHSVLVMDINGDGFDDLLVSEPLYSKTAGYDEGLVFVYMNDQSARAISNWVRRCAATAFTLGYIAGH